MENGKLVSGCWAKLEIVFCVLTKIDCSRVRSIVPAVHQWCVMRTHIMHYGCCFIFWLGHTWKQKTPSVSGRARRF